MEIEQTIIWVSEKEELPVNGTYLYKNPIPIKHRETILQALKTQEKLENGYVMVKVDDWKPFSTAPKDGSAFYVQEYYRVPFRWKPYSPKSQQFKNGIKGRWQEMNEYGGWDNTQKQPDEWIEHAKHHAAQENDDE